MKVGDKVRRKWRPQYGDGVIIHKLGETFVVKWYGKKKPFIELEVENHLRLISENR